MSYPFGLPASDDWSVAISADGLSAVLSTIRSGTAGVDMFLTSRPSPADTFGSLTKLTGLNSSANEQGSQFSADSKTFYFDSTRSGIRDLYRAPVTLGGFGTPEPIAELNTPDADEAVPVVSADELTIYFHSTRGSDSAGDIWMARRASKQAPFTDITLVPPSCHATTAASTSRARAGRAVTTRRTSRPAPSSSPRRGSGPTLSTA